MSRPSDEAASVLQLQRDERGVYTFTLNDPARFNALGEAMLAALQQALDTVAADEHARAVVLAAQGRAFCAGHNLKEMAQHPELAYYQQLFTRCSRVMLAIHKLPVPVIARVQGMATAAGCQLVAQCDLAVAEEGASFATSGIHYGLFCATPSVPLVRNVPVPAYSKGMDIREVVEMMWIPRLEEFQPEMMFISAGFDAHREDDMGQLGLTEQDFSWITQRLKDVARRYCKGRIVSCLEGGYIPSALARSVEAHLRVLADV